MYSESYSEPDAPRRGYAGPTFAIIVIGLIAYLGIAAVEGQHGLLRLFEIEREEEALRSELAQISAERVIVDRKVRGLSAATLDRDLLDEQARRILGLGHPDELILE